MKLFTQAAPSHKSPMGCWKQALLVTLVGSWLLGQAAAAKSAVLAGSEPDPTFSGNSMQLWLRGDQGVTAGTTFTWADQSTHGNNATQTGTARPTYVTSGAGTIGGMPAVEFDGVEDSLSGSLSSNLVSDSFTAFIVYHTPDAQPANAFHPFDGTNGGTNRFGFASYYSVTQKYFMNFSSPITSSTPLNTNPLLFSSVGTPMSTNTITQDLNGSNILTHAYGATSTITGYRVGSRFDGTAAFLDGSIAELIIYDQPLNGEDYNAVGYYLQDKYGLSGAFTAPLVVNVAVPEPSGLALVLLGGVALVARRRHRRRGGEKQQVVNPTDV